MSLSVTEYPVNIVGQNLLAGKYPIEIKFKREDIIINSIQVAPGETIQVNLNANIASFVNLNEYVYINSGDYDVFSKILEINASYLRLDTIYIGASSGGFMNYKQDYYIELDLVNIDNELIKILPFTLKDNGNPNGLFNINLAIVNDLNTIDMPTFDAITELTTGRVIFDVKYREIWRESLTTVYTRINNPIVVIQAKEVIENEAFTNGLENPEFYVGYPNGAVFSHTSSESLVFYFDQLDINKNLVSDNNIIGTADLGLVGKIFVPLIDFVFEPTTKYFTLKAEGSTIPEFAPLDFSKDFNIGQ